MLSAASSLFLRVASRSHNCAFIALQISFKKFVSHAAKISPPLLRLNVTEQPAIVVRVKPPRELVRKLHSNLYYKIYLIHPSGEEVRTNTHTHSHQTLCCASISTLIRLGLF